MRTAAQPPTTSSRGHSAPTDRAHGKRPWREKVTRSGYFLGAVLLHLVLFLLIAARVIFPARQVPYDVFHPATVRLAPPPVAVPPPPSHEMTVETPDLSNPHILTTTDRSEFPAISLPPLTPSVTSVPFSQTTTSSAGTASPDALGSRFSRIKAMEKEKWQRADSNIPVTDNNPRMRWRLSRCISLPTQMGTGIVTSI